MGFSGLAPNGKMVEIIELAKHPFFVATQAHPEFKSKPHQAHPLFRGFIAAALGANKPERPFTKSPTLSVPYTPNLS